MWNIVIHYGDGHISFSKSTYLFRKNKIPVSYFFGNDNHIASLLRNMCFHRQKNIKIISLSTNKKTHLWWVFVFINLLYRLSTMYLKLL